MLFQAPELNREELDAIARVEEARRRLGYLGQAPIRWYGLLRRVAFARAVRGSSGIEGYHVSVEDAMAAAVGGEPLEASADTWAAVQGYQQAMTYVLSLADDPHFGYSTDLLRGLHYMMMQHELGKHPGRWRLGPIYIRDDALGAMVYEGPTADAVPALMEELVEALNQPDAALPGIIRGAMGHLNLAMIHPFSDGNGRMARCLQTLVIARSGTLAPPFCSIEEYLGQNTPAYYDVLAEVGGGRWQPARDARPWVRFCITAHYRQVMTLLQRSQQLRELWDRLEEEVAWRGLPERMLLALADAATGLRVRNASYRSAAEVSDNLASRDLGKLVEAGLLEARGEKRGRYYVAAPVLQAIHVETTQPRRVADPFASA